MIYATHEHETHTSRMFYLSTLSSDEPVIELDEWPDESQRPSSPNGVDWPSPELSPSEDEAPDYFDDRARHQVIDLTDPGLFDEDPVLVMQDQHARVEIHCLHCSIKFHWTTDAIQHWSSPRHALMMAFLHGEPMVYCVLCNLLPEMPHRHLDGKRHARALRRSGRGPLPSDVQVRRVYIGADGRRRALLVE